MFASLYSGTGLLKKKRPDHFDFAIRTGRANRPDFRSAPLTVLSKLDDEQIL
jgi:hypothetical protein